MGVKLDISRKSLLATVAYIAVAYPNTWARAQENQGETELPPVSVEQQPPTPQSAQPSAKAKPAPKPAAAAAKSKPKPKPQAAPTPPPSDSEFDGPSTADSSGRAGGPSGKGAVSDVGERDYKVDGLSSAKFTEPLRDTPQSVQVIPKAVIKEQTATSLRDVLRNVPGISITAGEGNPPGGDQFKIRGFQSRNDIFLDGLRDPGNYFRDPFNLDGVEIIKGPNSSIAGRGSTGATVNQVSKEATFGNFFENVSTVGDGLNSEGPTLRSTIDGNYMLDGIDGAVRLSAMVHDSGVPGRDFVEQERWGFAPSLTLGLNSDTRMTLSYVHQEQDNLPDYGIPTLRETAFAGSPFSGQVAPVNFNNFYGYTQRDYEDVTTDMVTLKLEHQFSENLTIRNQSRYAQIDVDSIYSAPRIRNNTMGQITDATLVRGNAKFRDTVDDFYVNQTDAIARFHTGAWKHTLVTGVELVREVSENDRRLDVDGYDTNLLNPDPTLPLTPAQLGVYNGTRAKLDVDTVALYLQDTIKLDRHWSIVGTARYDMVDTRVRAFNDGTVPTYAQDIEREDNEFSWKAGLVYKPVENGSVYVSYGTSFEPVASLASSGGLVQLAGGNNNLPASPATFFAPPEESETYEIGAKYDLLDNRLALTGAIFRIDKTNARNVDALDPTIVTIDGEQRVDGFEVGIAGALTESWRIFAGYTFLDSEILKSSLGNEGREIDNTPRHSFALWTTYRFPSDLELGFGATYVGERENNVNFANQIPVTVDSYWRFDAMASYPISDNLTARLNLYNVGNEQYIDQLGSGQAVPGQDFTALFSLVTKFGDR
jgi:catecholate siderophore receptor